MMKIKQLIKQLTQSLSVALLIGLPAAGWSTTVSDRPLFIDAAVAHNLMFVVDDSGSMDFEVLAPAVGGRDEEVDSYIFDPGQEPGDYNRQTAKYISGKRILGTSYRRGFDKQYYYLRSPDYNLQYYDPDEKYRPWPSYDDVEFGNQSITAAELDPGLSGSLTFDLTKAGALGLGADNIPATLFVKINEGEIVSRYERKNYQNCPSGQVPNDNNPAQCGEYVRECFFICRNVFKYQSDRPYTTTLVEDTVKDCSVLGGSSLYSDWRRTYHDSSTWILKKTNGTELGSRKIGLAPDGACLQRLEFKGEANNKQEVYDALNGEGSVDSFFVSQQQNFANWFSYYRRRHQAVRGAIAESVSGLENMKLGIFWMHNLRNMDNKLYSSDAALDSFLNDHYGRFGSGSWTGGGTPARESLQHAGRQYAKTNVRGTLECSKNFTLLFSDGYANSHPGSTYAGNADRDAEAPFSNRSHSDTLGDIAYYYYEGLRNNGNVIPGGAMRLPVQCGTDAEEPWMDCNTDYHMNTYTVALGMEGENFAGKGYSKVIDAHKNPPNWSSSSISGKDNAAQIDDLYHAAVNGKGEYYDARSTSELILALKQAVRDVQQQLGSGSNLSFNTTSLQSGGYIFAAEFMSQVWSGTLRAGAIDQDGKITNWVWDAGALLNARDLVANPRLILTYNPDSARGVEFAWGAGLNGAPKDDLMAGGNEALGQARLAYIRGENVSGSGAVSFRPRASRLGAIINSSPIYVGEPGFIWTDSMFGASPYSTFKNVHRNRQEIVYIGANDGMLHGFDANTGQEVLGYIPGFLYDDADGQGLNAVTGEHYKSYVDLPLNMSDVYIDNAWRTVLIGGSRGGKPGIFALDVTDPSQFSAANADNLVLWEFTDHPNLGNMTEAVQIALLDWGNGDFRWSAVFSNGYSTAANWKNGLFVIDIENPSDYKFIELATGSGLSPVRMVDHQDVNGSPNSDGVADRAYAGDLEGRLWAIDLTGGKDNWSADFSGSPLYVAKDSLNRVQPITAQPDIARNSFESGLSEPNLLVFFGTGKYLEAGDIPQQDDASDALPQSFYGINDRGTATDTSGNVLTRGHLTNRVITTGSVMVAGENRALRKTDGDEMDWSSKYGWYVDLPSSGERVVEPARVRGDYIVFTSTIPTGGDPCGGGGSSFVTALQLDGSTDEDKSIIDVNNDGKLDDADKGWAGFFYGDGIITSFALIDNVLVTSDSGAKKLAILTNFGGGENATGRIGWTELVDY